MNSEDTAPAFAAPEPFGPRTAQDKPSDHSLDRWAVLVAMEEIRPVLVGMNHAFVFVSMRMASRSGQAGMAMLVVTVIMAMDMFVAKRLMLMDMNVALHQKKRYRGDEQSRRQEVSDGERLMENRGRESNPDERRDGEDDLGSRGAKPLSGCDVQHDAGAIRTRADKQSG